MPRRIRNCDGNSAEVQRKDGIFMEIARERRCDSLTRLLAIVCPGSSNGKNDRQLRRERWNAKGMEPK